MEKKTKTIIKEVKEDINYSVLETLKSTSDYISGEELAQRLRISRQALWKHISKLSERGYKISAVPHLGYRLISIPDKLYPWEIKENLPTKYMGKIIYHYNNVDSTQEIAWQLGLNGLPEGTVVIAETQKKGRGRLKRTWFSPPGGIYLSLILKPSFILINEIPRITILAGLACIYAIKKATKIECSLKWPNDIFLGEKKLGGILSEINAEQDKVNFVVLGIGINVNTKDLPPEATSLFLYTQRRFLRREIVKHLLEEMEALYEKARKEGFDSILKQWQNFCCLWNKKIKVKILNRQISGIAVGIDRNGYLLVKKENQDIELISAGDVTKISPS